MQGVTVSVLLHFIVLVVMIELSIGQFTCFRKFNTKLDVCVGLVKKKNIRTAEQCCIGNGKGFSDQDLVQKGRNRYTCKSCEQWRKEHVTTPIITTATGYPSEWGQWDVCSTTCGTGIRFRHRMCTKCDTRDLRNRESMPCIVHYYCPIDGNWGSWLTWASCTASCDGGTRRRERHCDSTAPIFGGNVCVWNEEDEEACNIQPCSADGNWGQWSHFGHCSHSCGRGKMSRTRECNSPPPLGSGQLCRGPRVDIRNCEKRKCPTHGGWSTWQEWSACSVTCDSGTRVRSRICDRPRPAFSGNDCEGSSEEMDVCDTGSLCQVNGGWSEWSSFRSCRAAPCARGYRLLSRSCNNPRPQNRGSMCRGESVQRIPCTNEEGCRVDGNWCDYGPRSPCSVTCLGSKSTQTRFRSCYCPAPENGGKPCEESAPSTAPYAGKVIVTNVHPPGEM